MTRAVAMAVVLLASAGWAQRVRFALHPVNAPSIEDSALVRALDNEASGQLASTRRYTLVDADEVRAQLAPDGGRCPTRIDERLRCLERLALTTRAVYALEVEVKRLGKTFELSATIAAANRTTLRQPGAVTVTVSDKAKTQALLRDGLIELLVGRLKIQELPADPKEEVARATEPPAPPPTAPTPSMVSPAVAPPAVNSTVSASSGSGASLRPFSYVAGGLAVALAATAVGVGLSARADAAALMAAHEGQMPPYALKTDEVPLARAYATKNGVTLGASIGAGVCAAAAVALFLVSARPADQLAVLPTVGSQSAGLTVAGRF